MGEQNRREENASQRVQSILRSCPVPNLEGIFLIEDRSALRFPNQAADRTGPLHSPLLRSATKQSLKVGSPSIFLLSLLILFLLYLIIYLI
jgi:hypothetical protein